MATPIRRTSDPRSDTRPRPRSSSPSRMAGALSLVIGRAAACSSAQVDGDLKVGLRPRAAPGRGRSIHPWCAPGRCRPDRRRRTAFLLALSGPASVPNGTPMTLRPTSSRRLDRARERFDPVAQPAAQVAACAPRAGSFRRTRRRRKVSATSSRTASIAAAASSPGIKRRSTSISHQSGTTLTLWPPSIRPTDKRGRAENRVGRAMRPACRRISAADRAPGPSGKWR